MSKVVASAVNSTVIVVVFMTSSWHQLVAV